MCICIRICFPLSVKLRRVLIRVGDLPHIVGLAHL